MVWVHIGPPQSLPSNVQVEVFDEGNTVYYGEPALQEGEPEEGEIII